MTNKIDNRKINLFMKLISSDPKVALVAVKYGAEEALKFMKKVLKIGSMSSAEEALVLRRINQNLDFSK